MARAILFLLATLFLSSGCSKKAQAPPPPPTVEVAEVKQQDVPIYHEWIGTLDGLVNAQIRAQVTGYLQTQNYTEGDPVKKGDLLFQIDPRPFEAELDRTKGQLAQAEAQLGKTELDVKRFTPLATTKAISQEELDDAVQAQLAAAAAVASAKAAVEQAQLNLGFTKIVSPIDGIPGIARAQIGDLVGPSTGEFTTVSTLDPIKLYYYVTEQAYINFTRLFSDEAVRNERARQLELQLIFADGSVYPREGRIYAVDRQINPATGALRVAALFPNPGNALRPGQFARVRVKFDTRKGALLVPQRAVSELQGAYQVAIVGNENKVHIQPVKTGERTRSEWIIEDGLKPGDRVVVEGLQKVREGTTVNPQPFATQVSAAAAKTQ
jgi:membrane fusion protein (multidrug efflux system)